MVNVALLISLATVFIVSSPTAEAWVETDDGAAVLLADACDEGDGYTRHIIYVDPTLSSQSNDSVTLSRIIGNVASSSDIPEQYSSQNIAEVFRFSPELYLALLSEGRDYSGNTFNSILSLPPAF